jgi:hypothetical protein
MKIGFTGTQQGMTGIQAFLLKCELVYTANCEFHHGDCVGADAHAHAIASAHAFKVVIHPPIKCNKRAWCKGANVTVLPTKDYIARNHDIVDATDMLIATPKTEAEELRSGTWATVRYARKQGKPVVIVYPSGRIERERGE